MSDNVKHHVIEPPEAIRRAVWHYADLDSPVELRQDVKNAILHGKMGLSWNIGVVLGFGEKRSKNERAEIDHTRHLVLAWLFSDLNDIFAPMSSKALTPQMINGVAHWITETLPSGERRMRATFREELRWIIGRAKTDLQRTTEAIEQGQDLTFGDCLKFWAETSSITKDDEKLEYWLVDDFAENYVTEEVIERWRKDAPVSVTKPESSEAIPDLLSEYF